MKAGRPATAAGAGAAMTGSGIHLQKRLSRAGRTTLIGLIAAVTSWVVLFGTLQAALSVPSLERLSPLARAGALDYSTGPLGLFESLRSAFIAKILGLRPSVVSAESASSAHDPVFALPIDPLSTVSIPGRLPRMVVEHPFDNDDFADAHPISAIPFTGKTDTRQAERERGEPDNCEPIGGTVWYHYRPVKDVGLFANSFGSDHQVALAVFRGSALSDLTLVGCEIHPGGNAQVAFPAKKGRSYFFQVAAPVTGGKLVFNLDPVGATEMVSVARNGKESAARHNGESSFPAVSDDGRYISFQSTTETHVWRKEKKTCYWRHLGDLARRRRNSGDCFDVYVRDMLTGRTELISKNSRGASSNGVSLGSAISGDGRYVAFQSIGTNLVPDDNNDAADIFVHDRVANTTERVTLSSDGEEGTIPWGGNRLCKDAVPRTIPEFHQGFRELCNGASNLSLPGITISSDGRYVVYSSVLHGLVEPEPPHCTDAEGVLLPLDAGNARSCHQIYVHDRKTHETRLVSASTGGEAGEGDSAGPFISRNGRWVAFSSTAPNLVDNDTNRRRDVFVHDLRRGSTDIISLSTTGEQGDGDSGDPGPRGHSTVSDDGRWVAFTSDASNLTPDDGNSTDDVFLTDRWSGRTRLVTGPSDAPSSPSDLASAGHASITSDGRFVAFTSELRDSAGGRQDVFVFDRIYNTITRVSVATSGEACRSAPPGWSQEPELSADGRFVAFESTCHNFDERYKDKEDILSKDIFIHEMPWLR